MWGSIYTILKNHYVVLKLHQQGTKSIVHVYGTGASSGV